MADGDETMTQSRLLLILACLVIGSVGIGGAGAPDTATVTAKLTGFQRVPAFLSNGTVTFRGPLGVPSLMFTLTFSGLSSPVTASHIHFGQRDVEGAVTGLDRPENVKVNMSEVAPRVPVN